MRDDIMRGEIYDCGARLASVPVDDWPDYLIDELLRLRTLLADGPFAFAGATKQEVAILLALEHHGIVRIVPGYPCTFAELIRS